MEKTTHTPGPWHYHESEVGGFRRFSVYSHNPVKCLVDFDIVAHERKEQNDKATIAKWEAAEANARLIAAAPELLEALKVAEQWLREHTVNWGSNEGQQIRAAIAKARGDSLSQAA